MKLSFHLSLFGAVLLLAASCKKQDFAPPAVPGSVDTTAYLQFTIQNMAATETGTHAIISLVNSNGDTTVNNRKIPVTKKNQQFITEPIALQRSSYSLVKFIVVKLSDTALYVVPKKESSKAALVTAPLPAVVAVAAKGVNAGTVGVLPVNSTDMPAQFGYTVNEFGFVPYINITAHLQIKTGSVLYDSLPGTIKMEAVDANGTKWIREQVMKAGLYTLSVPANYHSYTFSVNKWNTTIQKHYTQNTMQSGMHMKLYAEKESKKLKEEMVYVENGYDLIPENRSEFFYNANGTLKEIKFYQRSTVVAGLPLSYWYRFHYSQPQAWDTMFRYDAQQQLTGYTAMERSGDRIASMYQKSYDQQTGVAVSYSLLQPFEVITADYLFHNSNSMRYRMKFYNGNKTEDQAQSSTGGAESSTYSYDHEINPYHQLGYDDLYFTNASKNNITAVLKGYSGNIPSVVPYKYEYLYDGDGYPKELYISYKGYTSQQHLYRLKKVFRYQ